jgi:hypothetical protein
MRESLIAQQSNIDRMFVAKLQTEAINEKINENSKIEKNNTF